MYLDDLEFKFKNLKQEVLNFKNKKILLTGGLGFLGYNFVNFFNVLNQKKKYNITLHIYDIVKKNKLPDWFNYNNKHIKYENKHNK